MGEIQKDSLRGLEAWGKEPASDRDLYADWRGSYKGFNRRSGQKTE